MLANYRLNFIVITIALSGLLSGFDTAMISGALPFISNTFMLAKHVFLQELVVGIVVIGGLLGTILIRFCSEHVGRRHSLLFISMVFIIGSLIAATAVNIYLLLVGRFILGLAVGGAAVLAPLYLGEMSAPKSRGRDVYCYQLAVTIGFLCAYLVNFLFSIDGNWRMMFVVGGLIALALLLMVIVCLPESPRWLVAKSRYHEAEKITDNYFAADKSMNIGLLKNSLVKAENKMRGIFTRPILMLLFVAIIVFCLQSCTGINAVLYYAQTIFAHTGFQAQSAALAPVALGVANFVAACLGTSFIDRFGRRKLLLYSYLLLILCLVALGVTCQGLLSETSAWLSLVLLFVYVFCFGIGMGGIPYVLMAEIFPQRLRDSCMAISCSIGLWGSNIIILLTFLSMTHALGMADVFWCYAGVSSIGLIFCYFMLPEVSQLSLEQSTETIC